MSDKFEFPEPLFESSYISQPKACLACGKSRAKTVLRTTSKEICPLCEGCSADWNFYGYAVLKRIKPSSLMMNLLLFKLKFPFQVSLTTIFQDINSLRLWSESMRKFTKG